MQGGRRQAALVRGGQGGPGGLHLAGRGEGLRQGQPLHRRTVGIVDPVVLEDALSFVTKAQVQQAAGEPQGELGADRAGRPRRPCGRDQLNRVQTVEPGPFGEHARPQGGVLEGLAAEVPIEPMAERGLDHADASLCTVTASGATPEPG